MLKKVFNELERVEKEYKMAKEEQDYELCCFIMSKLDMISRTIYHSTNCQECILLETNFNDFLDDLGLETLEIIDLWLKSRYCYVDDDFIYLDYDGNICTASYKELYNYYEVDELLEMYNEELDDVDYGEILYYLNEI